MVTPEIRIVRAGDGVRVTAVLEARAAMDVSTELEIRKTDGGGTVRSTQRGSHVTVAGGRLQLAKLTLSLAPGGTIAAALSVSQNGTLLADTVQSFSIPLD